VHVQKIKIRNVRGFREVDLDLTRPDGTFAGWTVLAGRNGSGKSTLLRAVAFGVAGPAVASTLAGDLTGWIKRGEDEASVEAELALSPQEARSLGKTSVVKPRLTWRANERLAHLLMSDGLNLGPWSLRQEVKGYFFLAGYGPYRRLTGHATDAQRLMAGPDQVARLVSLFREDSSLVECVQWLREIYLRRLEDKPGAAELEKAVLSLLNDGLLPGGLHVEGIDSEALWVRQHRVRLPLEELSDGYRTVAALVMDIVRHLHRCFGELHIESAKDSEGTCQRVLHPGVVLIDEVELHLHISWQKQIGFWLKRHFPNIQFIVTTHSPFVCQAADRRGLIRLPGPGEDRPVEHVSEDLYYTVVNGSADDAVLTELFGPESPYSVESEKLREDVAQLEAKLQTGKATKGDEQELEELRSQLPQTPTSNIEQVLRKLTADI
jgi:hypothetical protein